MQCWIQSGLVLSPLVATCTQYSVDFCLAWALIGEWTSRILFPVPKGPWPRHGHAGALLEEYQARSPRIVAWARASFEQGALPSLLFLQGLVPIFTLPGDRMFQATGCRQRPPIMHAYGGAKFGMAQALQSIASEGWIPLAAAMVGTVGKQPLWADLGLRPVVGTTVDIKLWPRPLKHRDVVLLLSCWKRWDHESISESAINTWLKSVNMAYGPDCEDSPHFRRSNIDDLEAMQLLGDCGFDFLPETDLQKRPNLPTSQLQKVLRDRQFFSISTWKCASRHSGVQFFYIATSKSGPNMQCFAHFHLQMCFSPQQRAIFQHLNFKKCSEADMFCAFSLQNVLLATAACNFSTSQLQKVLRTPQFFSIFT